MICQYCSTYDNSAARDSTVIGKKRFYERYCPKKDKYIGESERICQEFRMTQYFWCNKTGNRIRPEVCARRRANDTPECIKCHQKNSLMELRRILTPEGTLRYPNIVIPTIKKRRKE